MPHGIPIRQQASPIFDWCWNCRLCTGGHRFLMETGFFRMAPMRFSCLHHRVPKCVRTFSMSRSGFQSRRRMHPDVGYGNPACEAGVTRTYLEVTCALLLAFLMVFPKNGRAGETLSFVCTRCPQPQGRRSPDHSQSAGRGGYMGRNEDLG